jgi:hypothetical protein
MARFSTALGTATMTQEIETAFYRKKPFILIVLMMAWFIVLLLAGEGVVRMRGRIPLMDYATFFSISGKRIVQEDPVLGYTHTPGSIEYADATYTHLENTLRITHPRQRAAPSGNRPEIWLFGCSITHGFGLNDEETFAWKLQERMPECEIVNFGVDGYSTVQSLLQLREALEDRGHPAAATLVYGEFHDERSVLARNWWKGNRQLWDCVHVPQPRARLDAGDKLRMDYVDIPYRLFPGATFSALANLIDEQFTLRHDRPVNYHRTGEALVFAFAEECSAADVPFMLSSWTPPEGSADIIFRCEEKGIPVLKAGVLATPENFHPSHGHPTPKAAAEIAARLEKGFRDLLSESPHPEGPLERP